MKSVSFWLAVFCANLCLFSSQANATASDIELRDQSATICSGEIISAEWVLIEAMCVVNRPRPSLSMTAGGVLWQNQQTVSVADYTVHLNFSTSPLQNNVALVRLATPLVFNDHVQPLSNVEYSRFPLFVDWTCSESGVCPNGPCPADQARVSIFPNGLAFDSTTQDLCVGSLGVFDPVTGVQLSDNFDLGRNGFVLRGKYVDTALQSLPTVIDRFTVPSNDFRINPAGISSATARQSTLWSSEAHLYYYVDKYRSLQLNDAFINSLGLPTSLAANLQNRQYRPNLQGLINSRIPWGYISEQNNVTPSSVDLGQNNLNVTSRQRAQTSDPLDSMAFDPGYIVGLYSGVLSNWITAGTAQWPNDPTWGDIGNLSWLTDVRPAILEGFKLWNGYRATQKSELNRYAMQVLRRWAGNTCGTTTTAACDKGWNIENSMMYLDTADPALNNPSNPSWPPANSDDTLLFPYRVRAGVGLNHFGPQNSGLGGMFVAALFYDISKEIGLGDYKADQLFWKTVSLVDPGQAIDMTALGVAIQQAARALWPSSTPGQSWYEQDLVDVLSARGIRMNGAPNFLNNIPAAVGTAANPGPGSMTVASTNGIGSTVPESQRNSSTGYNFLSYFTNGYTVTTPGTQYVTYQFYKHSKYGACDRLDLTNGSINTISTTNPIMNHDGSLATSYSGRSLGNLLLLAPGTTLNFLRRRMSCVSEKEGYYPEDIRAFGFRVVKATPNGFTLAVQRMGVSNGRYQYQINIVDPSLALTGPNTGPATYNWTFTEYNGQVVQATGQQTVYNALPDQPFTISVDRIRGAQTDNITLRERGNDFDRAEGRQFNQDFWNAGYDVGFDTIVDRRLVEGHGSYVSALNPVGSAFGVQAHRWTTPNHLVQPIRFSTVTHGLPSGSNPGPYQFQNAQYYNACIWSSRSNVTNYPGCRNDSVSGDVEVQIPFSATGIDLADPFATVTVGSLPGYLWSVEFPSNMRLQPNTEYHFGSHISASVVNNGYSYNLCSYAQAPGTAGQPDDQSDWLAGANWSGTPGVPSPQTMRQFLSSSSSVASCTYSAYKFEGRTVTQ